MSYEDDIFNKHGCAGIYDAQRVRYLLTLAGYIENVGQCIERLKLAQAVFDRREIYPPMITPRDRSQLRCAIEIASEDFKRGKGGSEPNLVAARAIALTRMIDPDREEDERG